MKDVYTPVRIAYKNRLDGAVFYDSVAVPVYGRRVPVNAAFPYIYFSSQSSVNDGTKSSFTTNHEINVEIVWRSETGMEQYIIDDLSNQVMQLIATMRVQDNPELDSNFYNVGTRFERSSELTDYDNTFTYLRKILTFSNIIYERAG